MSIKSAGEKKQARSKRQMPKLAVNDGNAKNQNSIISIYYSRRQYPTVGRDNDL